MLSWPPVWNRLRASGTSALVLGVDLLRHQVDPGDRQELGLELVAEDHGGLVALDAGEGLAVGDLRIGNDEAVRPTRLPVGEQRIHRRLGPRRRQLGDRRDRLELDPLARVGQRLGQQLAPLGPADIPDHERGVEADDRLFVLAEAADLGEERAAVEPLQREGDVVEQPRIAHPGQQTEQRPGGALVADPPERVHRLVEGVGVAVLKQRQERPDQPRRAELGRRQHRRIGLVTAVQAGPGAGIAGHDVHVVVEYRLSGFGAVELADLEAGRAEPAHHRRRQLPGAAVHGGERQVFEVTFTGHFHEFTRAEAGHVLLVSDITRRKISEDLPQCTVRAGMSCYPAYAFDANQLVEQSLAALDAGRQVIARLPLADAVATAAERVREGQPLSRALGASRQFPPLLIHMLANGEATGRVDELLDRAARLQQAELENRTAALTALLEPVLLLLMGGFVLLIVMAVMQPIIEINTLMK